MAHNAAIIQARYGATRLPGKVLTKIAGREVLGRVIDRIRTARRIDRVVVATTDAPADDAVAEFAAACGVDVFRGSEQDVLGRFHAAATAFAATTVVRVNADNPLIDGRYCDDLVAAISEGGADYVSFRAGQRPVMLTALSFFAEAMTFDCLDRANREVADSFQREHVTLGIYTAPERFRVRWLACPPLFEDQRLRFTLDTPDDLAMLNEVIAALGEQSSTATAEEIVRLVARRPDWLERMAAANAAQPKSAGPGPKNQPRR
jgi:spore coat polysaccharide biosynthesis protein SpsF